MSWEDLGALFTPTEKTKLAGVATGADVTGDNTPKSHDSSHEHGGGDVVAAGKIKCGSGNPANPEDGSMYFNTTTKRIIIYNAAFGGWGYSPVFSWE